MESKHLKAACLGAALATAWGAAQEAHGETIVTIGFNYGASVGSGFATSISHSVFAYSYSASSTARYGSFSIDSGTPVQFSSALDPTDFNKYVLVGLESPGHVVVSMSAGIYESPFESVFPGYNEADIATLLNADSPNAPDLVTFTNDLLAGSYAQNFGDGADAVRFSDGERLGNVGADANLAPAVVPLPSASLMGFVLMGGTGLASWASWASGWRRRAVPAEL